MKLHPQMTNHDKLKHLCNAVKDIAIDANLAVKLNLPHNMQQTEAMTNSDVFTPDAPFF